MTNEDARHYSVHYAYDRVTGQSGRFGPGQGWRNKNWYLPDGRRLRLTHSKRRLYGGRTSGGTVAGTVPVNASGLLVLPAGPVVKAQILAANAGGDFTNAMKAKNSA
jgi:hypothetical protein